MIALKKSCSCIDNHQIFVLGAWVTINPYHSILKLVARISARIFLGLPLCRDNQWLEISTEFTENGTWYILKREVIVANAPLVFVSLVVLRLFPMWTHYVLSWLLPSTYRGHRYIKNAKKLLIPEIERRRQAAVAGKPSTHENNLLSWMMEIASEKEGDAASLAHLEVVMSLASIHTSQMNAVHVLYDIVSRPEYMEPIREEIAEVAREEGPWMTWQKSSYTKLRKLDSFMRESQRFNPPTLLSMHRVMLEKYQFADGTEIPRNAHVSMAVNAIQNDPEVTPNPEIFDGFRYYNLRQRQGESHLHQFSTTQDRILNFGHGTNSCPGRFFASLEIKIILVRLIMDYEYKFPDGKGRPENLKAHEFIFPNPDGELLLRARNVSDRLVL